MTDKPFKRRRILPAYQELLDDHALQGGTDSTQIIQEDRGAFATSENVFRDLGFDEAEAEHLRIRSTLMIAVRKVIEDRSLTQVEAAKLFGVQQPRISNIVHGKIDLFSIDILVDMLARAGVHVDLVVSALREPLN